MSRGDTPTEDVRLLPETMQSLIEAWMARTSGAALLALSAVGWLSIITWSNIDPSLTQTTAEPTRNLLGPLGAIVSDLLLQTLGLASLCLLGGPLVWGLELVISRRLPKLAAKLILFPLAILVLAGGFSSLPTLPSWPLHHGFGGLIGDVVFNLAASIFSVIHAERAGALGGACLLAGGLSALVHSVGLSFNDLVGRKKGIAARPAVESRPGRPVAPEPVEPPMTAEPSRRVAEPVLEMPLPEPRTFSSAPVRRELNLAADELTAQPSAADHHDDPGLADARAFARRFAPASAAGASVSGGDVLPAPERSSAGPMKLPAILRGFSTTRAKGWRKPQIGLLKRNQARAAGETDRTALHSRAGQLIDVLGDFGVQGTIRDISAGPVVTLFELQPARGIKTSRVIALADDIGRAMSASGVRVAAVASKTTIGIELPNARRETVLLRDVIDTDAFRSGQATLPLALGRSIDGEPVVADLARMPHLLVAGTTGSGKSVGINAMILSLLFRHEPKDCRLLLIDPKMLELAAYDGVPHLLAPVVTDHEEAVAALQWAVAEMEERYKRMARIGVRNLEAFNNKVEQAAKRGGPIERKIQTGFDRHTGQPIFEHETLEETTMAHIVIIVDEFADLMMTAGKELETAVQRLSQKARAAGLHLIMATQRPSVDIVTGSIKANFPSRIGFRVASKIDSRTILGEPGAEQLLGQGDMLMVSGTGQFLRVHGAYVSDEEIEAVVSMLKAQGRPDYAPGVIGAASASARHAAEEYDSLYGRAVEIVTGDGRASANVLQRRLGIAFNRASALLEQMERDGIVTAPHANGRRDVIPDTSSDAA